MIKTCGFKAIDNFISSGIWLSVKSMESILRDAGYEVKACKVTGAIKPPIVDIGYKNEHYYNMSEAYGEYPDVAFLSPGEITDNVRVLTAEECERLIGGKGGTTMNYPSAPPQPTVGESMADWVKYNPEVFAQQLEMAPQEAQQQLELLQQYGQPIAQAYKSAQDALYPETTALQEQMSRIASRGMEQGLSPAERAQYQSDFSANLGTNAGSPMGADYMSRNMMMAQQGRQDQYMNAGLSLAGRQPLAQPSQPQTSNYMGQFGPQQTMNMNAGTYGAYAAATRPFAFQEKGGLMGWLGM